MRNEVIIQKLLGYTEKILEYCRNFTYTDFCENTMTVEAVCSILAKWESWRTRRTLPILPATRKSPGGICTACGIGLYMTTRV